MTQPPPTHYIAPDEERAALATLAAAPYPGEAAAGWDDSLFTLADAPAALAAIRAAVAPIALDLAAAPVDGAALAAIRTHLGELSRMRQVETVIGNAAAALRKGKGNDTLLDDIRDALDQIRHARAPQAAATMGELSAGYWHAIAQWSHAAPTGLEGLDRLLGGGLLPGRLVALLGAPGSGKSSLACQISEGIASMGRPVVYLTSEDSPHMLLCRAWARLYNLDYGALLRGWYKREDLDRHAAAYEDRQSARRLLIVDQHGPFRIETLRQTARRHFAHYDAEHAGGPGLIVIDYLQRLARSGMGENQQLRDAVTGLTESMRDIAVELGCCVLVLSAQHREAYKSGNGGGSALATGKESGDLEYTADALMALGSADPKDAPRSSAPGHETRLLRLDKNRQGMTGALFLDWYGPRQMFAEVQ